MHILLNSLAASAASGLTYIRNVVPHLARRNGIKTTVLVSRSLRDELGDTPNLTVAIAAEGYPTGRRFWFEQRKLPALLHRNKADVLISAGNFAIRRSPVPQILLSGNALYFSAEFARDLLKRGEKRAWLDLKVRSWLANRSIHWADCTVAPSEAFARQLEAWSGCSVRAVHHGFDEGLFRADSGPPPADLQRKLAAAGGSLRLLHVSHYNYFRNFETLFRALPLLKGLMPGTKVKLVLTCELKPGADTAGYDPQSAATLIRDLGIEQDVVQLGVVPHRLVHHVYRACDVYVTAAYAESFAHPTVEAMSCGLPIVASDLAVHREICQDAALYAPCFSPQDFALRLAEIAGSRKLASALAARGPKRAHDFSWGEHVDELLAIAGQLVGPTSGLQVAARP
jgi:glycosyltransferase involved in cell wall biosynthesis